MFSYTPLTEAEIAEMRTKFLLPAGEYPFIVNHVEKAVSKAGNDMLVVTLAIASANGKMIQIKDYITDKMRFKLKHFLETLGLTYGTSQVNISDILNKTGSVILKVEKGESDSQGGFFPDKNVVRDYAHADAKAPAAPGNITLVQPAVKHAFDDDIKF